MIDNETNQPTIPVITVAECDRDGAIREAFVPLAGRTRAELLGGAAIGGAALLAAIAAPGALGAPTARRDRDVLNFALTLEYLQAAFYTQAEKNKAIRGKLATVPRELGATERAHVSALRNVLGASAVKRPFFNFKGTTEAEDPFLRTAVAFEDLAVAAYKGQAPELRSPELLASAVSIHSVEARHAAWMRYLVGVQPAANAFDEPRAAGPVRRTVRSTGFIVAAPRMTRKATPRFTG